MRPEFNYFNENAEDLDPISDFTAQTAKPVFRTILEAAGDGINPASVVEFADQQLRSQAMATALNWSEQGDFSFQALSDAVEIMNDMDGEDETTESTDEEDQEYSDLLTAVGYAFVSLGADASNVQAFIEDENDDEGAKLGTFLSEKLSGVTDDDETVIANYAVAGGDLVMESMIKVIRGGQLVFKKKRIGRAHKMNSLQRASLKKARSKAFSGAARIARKKSMRIRIKRGL